jgi:hypothetical protein
MPRLIVDLSARSKIINQEPYHLHFWECSPEEALEFLKWPRKMLESMGIELPNNCRVETTIENHDWISDHTNGLTQANGTIVCNIGGGNVAREVYKVMMYGHSNKDVGKYSKRLLHDPNAEQRIP